MMCFLFHIKKNYLRVTMSWLATAIPKLSELGTTYPINV